MKKVINLLLAVLITGCVSAQWKYEKVDNGFDEPYALAYTEKNNGAFLYMIKLDTAVVLFLGGGYYCDDKPKIDVVLNVNKVDQKFEFVGYKSKSSDQIYITWDMDENPKFIKAFKDADNIKIRVNESYCTSEIYTFNMMFAYLAYNYVKR